jgi:predicted nucleic-acid-binding protein
VTEPDAPAAAFVDTDVLVRHLAGDHPVQSPRATAYLAQAETLVLTDVVVAELVHVLESVYRAPRERIRAAVRSLLAFGPVVVRDAELLLRAVEAYEDHRIDFAEAYLVASAERSGVGVIASFDGSLDRATTIRRVEPA